MSTPILSEIKDRLLSIRFYTQHGDSEYVLDLISEALDLTDHAIEAVQGALEDIHRVSGRVPVCTELHSLLAPNECTAEELIGRHPKLAKAYARLMRLDANGACCVASDILDAAADGCLDADRLADELLADCERMEREEE